MLSRMSSKELMEWIAFFTLEPFGSEAQFMGHAITASTVANVNRPKGRKAYKPDEFMPKFEKKEQTVDEMIQIAQAMTIAMGGEDKRK